MGSPQLASPEQNWLEDAWARFVLLRPGMDVDEFRKSTELTRTPANGWSWEGRTPGTVRTILITSATLCLFAIPVLVTNPLVLPRLLEAAALSMEGFSAIEFFEETGR